jgi:drug/metabolite transporter (DMT)-like permease
MVKQTLVYAYMGVYLVFGAATTIIIKAMDMITIANRNFAHPYIQCSNLFLGESLCLVVYLSYKSIKRKKNRVSRYQQLKRAYSASVPSFYAKLGVLSFGIPGILYVFSIYLMFIGLALSAASIYQIVRSILLLPVFLFSLIFLHRRFYRHQLLGLGLIILGVTVTIIDSFYEKSLSSRDPATGAIVLIVSQIIAGAVLVYEEYLMDKLNIEPIVAVGVEGAVGLTVSLLVLAVLNFIPCSSSDFCNGGMVENTMQVLSDIFSNGWLLLLFVSSFFVIAVLYWSGIYTTRYASALARATLDSARIVLVWVFSLLVSWEDFLWVELLGFVLLIVGTLLYNEILVLPFCGLKESVAAHQVDRHSLRSSI